MKNEWQKTYCELKDSILPDEEIKEYILEYQKTKDKNLLDKIVKSNLRYIIKIAEDQSKKIFSSIEKTEIVNTGVIGLIEAIENYKEGYNAAFLGYAIPYIKSKILELYRERFYPVTISKHHFKTIDKYKTLKKQCEINDIEITDEMIEDICVLKENIEAKSRRETIDFIKTIGESTSAFLCNDTLGEEVSYIFNAKEQETMLEESKVEMTFIQNEELETLKKFIEEEMMKILTSKELIVIYKYFGLHNYKESTLEDISEELNLTKARISQIKKIALKKLKDYLLEKGFNDPDSILTA